MNFLNKISISFKRNQAFNQTINGVITISDRRIDGTSNVQEDFSSSLEIWDIKTYKEQWRLAVERLETQESSCLIASINKDKTVTFWSLYKQDDRIFVYACTQDATTTPTLDTIWPVTPENSFNLIANKDEACKKTPRWKIAL